MHGKMQKIKFAKMVNFRFLFSADKLISASEKYFITLFKSYVLKICKNTLAFNSLHSLTDSRSFWQGFTLNAYKIILVINLDFRIGISVLDFISCTSFIAIN